jgi:hypothetical protein
MRRTFCYSWLDLFLCFAALALLVPLVGRFVEALGRAVREATALFP